VRQTMEVLDNCRLQWEAIFVDDFSSDATRRLIDEIIAEHPEKELRRIFHETNTGRGRAVSDGFRVATGEVIGYIDIDLEVHARYIPSMYLSIMRGGYDVATALRAYKPSLRIMGRHIMSNGYCWLRNRMLELPVRDTETGFKFFRRNRILPLLDAIEDKAWFWDTEIMALAWAHGLRIKEIPCLFVRQFSKKSSVHAIRDSWRGLCKLWAFRRRFKALAAARSEHPP